MISSLVCLHIDVTQGYLEVIEEDEISTQTKIHLNLAGGYKYITEH